MNNDELRGTGRTTAGMLRAIADALEHPDTWVPFVDHHHRRQPWQTWSLKALARSLELKVTRLPLTIDIKIEDGKIWLLSPIARMRAERQSQIDNRK